MKMNTASPMRPRNSQAMISRTGSTASCTQRGTKIVPIVGRCDSRALAGSSAMALIIAVGNVGGGGAAPGLSPNGSGNNLTRAHSDFMIHQE